MAQPRAQQEIPPSTKHPPVRIPYSRAPVADSAEAHKALPAKQVFVFFFSAAADEVSVLRGLSCLSCSAVFFFYCLLRRLSLRRRSLCVCVCVRARARACVNICIYMDIHIYPCI